MEGLGQLAQARPDILDNFDLDEGARKYALNNGVDSKLLMPIKKRDQIRAQRQAQQEKQNAMMQAEQMSKAAKNLGGAPQQVQDQAMQAAGG
jgi:hypothetical protein